LGLLGVSIQIAIEIGIEIVPLIAGDDLILSNLLSPSTQSAQHCGHAVQLHLAALALGFVQGFADEQDIGNGGTFQRRSACNFESPPAACIGSLAVALGDDQRDRLASPQLLVPCGAVDPDEVFNLLVNPGDATDRDTVDFELLVAQCHVMSCRTRFRFR
jgi:hypothetical protein